MLNFLPAPLIGIIATLLMVLNLAFWFPFLMALTLIKLVLPFKRVRLLMDPLIIAVAEAWISGNKGWINLTQKIEWDVQGIETLNLRGWYLVNSNHQSWVDILVLQYLLNRRIPFLKFFLKHELIWVPIMGVVWWALEYPFMRRYSEDYLKKHPEMRGKDQETTRQACAKYALVPTSVMNFLEGTRFTPAKHARQQSPYRYLLKPKAGGLALALNAMGDKFQAIVDVTIVYPDGIPTFKEFLQGKVHRVVVRMRTLPVPQHLCSGNYSQDPALREAVSQWVQALWLEKDTQIAELLAAKQNHPSPAPRP